MPIDFCSARGKPKSTDLHSGWGKPTDFYSEKGKEKATGLSWEKRLATDWRLVNGRQKATAIGKPKATEKRLVTVKQTGLSLAKGKGNVRDSNWERRLVTDWRKEKAMDLNWGRPTDWAKPMAILMQKATGRHLGLGRRWEKATGRR